MDATALRTLLASANISVLTSPSGSEVSYEKDPWQHGAFTKVLLDALSDPEADIDHNGLISTTGLERYIATRVPTLTDDTHHLDMTVRFEATLFAQGR